MATSTGWALEPADLLLVQKGPVVLKPQFQVTETFNDNITYRDVDQRADLITTLSPGFVFQYGTKELNHINLSYFFDRLQYAANEVLSANQHRIGFDIHYMHDRLTLDGKDAIEFLSSPLGGGISLGGQRVDRATFFDRYRLSYDFSDKTGLYLQGLHTFNDYQDNLPLYDQRTVQGTLGFQYRALSRTYFFGEVYYGQTETDPNISGLAPYPTADFVGMFLGAHGQFTERIGGMVKGGYEHRYYSDNGAPLDAPVIEMGVDWRVTDKSLLNLNYTRIQTESVQFVRSPYTLDTITADFRQDLGNEGRARADVTLSYVAANYESNAAFLVPQRNDDIYTFGLTFAYDIKLWLRAFGGYAFEYFNSNEPTIIDYKVNRITMGLQVGY